MREEIEAAVHFMGRVIISSNHGSMSSFPEFKSELSKIMEEKYNGHWHDEFPVQGQGYRCIRIHPTEPLDPMLQQAARQSKFNLDYLHIPVEFTIWVDPKDVCCRFGDLKATYCTVLKDEDNQASTLDVDELLENARALYSRQQHFVIVDGPPSEMIFNDQLGYGMNTMSYTDGCLFPMYNPFPQWQLEYMGDRSTPPPMIPYPMSFAVSTTPRKNGKGSHFRKGSNGTGRSTKHHHQHHHNGDVGFSNQNHANNHHHHTTTTTATTTSSSGNTPSSNISRSWPGSRFHWMKGAKNFHQFYSPLPSNHSFSPMQQQKQHQPEPPQQPQSTPLKKRPNSESDAK